MAPTQKQIRCVYALHKELGIEPKMDNIRQMSLEDCSVLIDEMRAKIDSKPVEVQQRVDKVCASFDGNNFGMAAKAVMEQTNINALLNGNSMDELFIGEIENLYRLLCRAREACKGGD